MPLSVSVNTVGNVRMVCEFLRSLFLDGRYITRVRNRSLLEMSVGHFDHLFATFTFPIFLHISTL